MRPQLTTILIITVLVIIGALSLLFIRLTVINEPVVPQVEVVDQVDIADVSEGPVFPDPENMDFSEEEEALLTNMSQSNVLSDISTDIAPAEYVIQLPRDILESWYTKMTADVQSSELNSANLQALYRPAEELTDYDLHVFVADNLIGELLFTPSVYESLSLTDKQILAGLYFTYFTENNIAIETEAELDQAFAPMVAKREQFLADTLDN